MFTKRNIYEYDIHKANISCLLEMGEISQEQYDMLKDIPKDERSKFVAAFERLEKDTAKDYRKYVAIALEKFKALNDIKEKDIIEIAFDAIWLDKEVSNLQVTENIRFICKRKASSILEIKKVKFYFNSADNTFFQRGLGQKESPWFEIIKEYKTLVNARSRGITFRKENLKDSETKFELIPFENILDDYLQQRQEIRDAKRIKRYSKPAGTGLTARTENALLRITLDEHKATIAQQEKKIEEFERVIVELQKAIEGRSKTITLMRDKLDEQDIELAYTNQQLKKAERQREQDQQQLSLFKAFASGFEKKNAELQQDAKQKETNIQQLNSQIKDIKEKYFQRKKENKELQEEVENLKKIIAVR